MTISERIFELLDKRGMSQKEFSEKTGIAQSSISDWKRKKTNPVSEKILIICNVLDVTPYELLGGTDGVGSRSNPSDMIRKSGKAARIPESAYRNAAGQLNGRELERSVGLSL